MIGRLPSTGQRIGSTRPAVVRILAIVVAAAALAWFSLALTIGITLAKTNPSLALAWWPFGANAKAGEAALIQTQDADQATIMRARTLSLDALARKPATVAASRTLSMGYLLQGNNALGARLLNYSERLSRRDVTTQLMLIESYVQRGDVAGALRHYDLAMRVSPEIRGTIGPVLVKAADDPAVAGELGKIMATRPSWWADIFQRLTGQSMSADSFAIIVRAMKFNPNDETDRTVLSLALKHVVALGAPAVAADIYGHLPDRMRAGLLPDGDFERVGGVEPFEWALSDNADYSALLEKRDGGKGAQSLSLYGAGGEVARELLVLAPGHYSLQGLAGQVQGDAISRPTLTLACSGPNATEIAAFVLPLAAQPTVFRQDLTVPENCPAQWLTVKVGPSVDRSTKAPWIDNLSIQKR